MTAHRTRSLVACDRERNSLLSAFDRASAGYDRLVGANPGYHHHLRLSASRMRLPHDGAGLRLLDAGCGTGASTAALLSVAPQAEITAVDASAGMLALAMAKPWPSSVRFVHTPVEEMADVGVHGPFHGVFAAYLVRNLKNTTAQLHAFHDLLSPGGTLAVHEYSVRGSLLARCVWHAVCWSIIIPMGRMVTGDTSLYRHLWHSVDQFDNVEAFRQRLRTAGFTGVHSETMTGWQKGVVHTFLGTAGGTRP